MAWSKHLHDLRFSEGHTVLFIEYQLIYLYSTLNDGHECHKAG